MTAKRSDEVWRDTGTYEDEKETAVGVSLFSSPKIPHYEAVAVFGSFEILGRLARGGMAEVYLAREKARDGSIRHLVLKKVLPDLADDSLFVEMFEAEGQLATRLYHPNVCHVYECGEIDGTPFLTLEWVYGVSFRDLLRCAAKSGGMPQPIAVEIIALVADALDYIHNAVGVEGKPLGIIHRDVSPHNVMVSWEGHVKLLDFGVAKTTAQKTEGGLLKGKFGYVSPEQLGDTTLDTRSDIFSLGVCLHEALTGQRLYRRESVLATLQAIRDEPAPSVRTIRAEVPEPLDRIVLRMLEKGRDRRFQTAGELRDALRDHMRATGTDGGEFDIAAYLDKLYAPSERAPLPEGSRDLTGSFPSLSHTDSKSLISEGEAKETRGGATAAARIEAETRAEPIAARGTPIGTSARGWVIVLAALALLLACAGTAYWLIELR